MAVNKAVSLKSLPNPADASASVSDTWRLSGPP